MKMSTLGENIFSYCMFAFCLPGIVYVRDTTRGGLCSYPVFNNGINGAFCRTEAGQTAAIIFLFVTMVVYLIGAMVCLKLWRHEAARRYRERYGQEVRAQLALFAFLLLTGLCPGIPQNHPGILLQLKIIFQLYLSLWWPKNRLQRQTR